MEFFPDDPEIQRLLPEETRILDMQAKPYPDEKRVRVTLDLTPFQKKTIHRSETNRLGWQRGWLNQYR